MCPSDHDRYIENYKIRTELLHDQISSDGQVGHQTYEDLGGLFRVVLKTSEVLTRQNLFGSVLVAMCHCRDNYEGIFMAKKEHLDLIKKEVSVWNKWRKNNSTEKPDLSNVNLCHSNLSRVNLSETNLWEANFSKAKLNGADFSGADLCFADFSGANLTNADFSGANLTNVDLSGANLTRADMRKAKLWGTNFSRADITGAIFDEADLSEAVLSEAVLAKVSFRGTNFSDAKLLKVKLSHTDFSHAIFNHTDLSESIVEWGTFANVDLSKIKGLDTLRHHGPSSIDINTIYRSGGNIPGVFLRGTGVPDDFINCMGLITEQPVRFYSCFISYSVEDQAFAEQLHIDLCDKNVRCWTECRTEKSAQDISHSIFRIHHSALLTVISENSVNSSWMEQEIQASFQEERRHKNIILFPLCLDSSLTNTEQKWAAEIPHITDFSQWKETDAYQKTFDRMFHDICDAFPKQKGKGVPKSDKYQPSFTSPRRIRSINFPRPPNEIKYKIIGDNGCPLYNLEDELKLSEKALLFPRDKAACLILLEDIMEVHTKYEKVGADTGYTFKCSGCTGMIRLKYQKEKPRPVSLDKIGEDDESMVSLLVTFPMFQSLHNKDIKYIVSFLHRKRFAMGDVVIKQGDPGRNLYIVVSGRIEVLGESGISIAFMGSGEVFGEMSLLSGNPVGAITIKVLEPVTVLYLNGGDFKKILNEYPSLQMYFTRLLAARMAEINLARSEEFASGMVGMLSEMPPSELLQTLNVNQKTGILSLQLSKTTALLSFREGQLVRVEYNNKEGKEAFYDILREKEGRFKFIPGLSSEDIQAEELEDFMWLLMEGMRRIDERDY